MDEVFNLVRQNREIYADGMREGTRYLGSIDPITAAQWAKESGLKIGTKEFAKYAKRKLADSDYRRFSG